MKRVPVRWIVVGAVVLAIAGLGYWGVKALSSGDEGELVMALKPVTRGDLEVTVRGWGQLQATEERDVLAGASGVIQSVSFQPDEPVQKGQVLATIDPGSLSVTLKQKEIALEAERIKLARAFGVPPAQVMNVEPEAALVLRSPSAGKVANLSVEAGSAVQGAVCKVVDDSRLLIKTQLSKTFFDQTELGTRTTFLPTRFAGENSGKVVRKDPTPISGSDTYYYEVWIEMKNPGLLKVGDDGILIIHGSGGDIQQKTSITSFGSEETVTASFSGKVKQVFVREGMVIKAGDPIIEFEAGDALLEAMTAQLGFRKLSLEVEDLRSQMQHLDIVAPIDGVAWGVYVAVGQTVDKGTRITRICNYIQMNLSLRVDEIDIPKLEVGQEAQALIWGREGRQSVPAVLSRLGSKGEPQDGLAGFSVTLSIDNPGFLRPGMGAEAEIYVSKKENVLLCPVEAVYKEEDKWFVDIKDGKNRKPVEVRIGLMNDRFAEILDGVPEGQEVIVGMSKQPSDQQGGPGIRPF